MCAGRRAARGRRRVTGGRARQVGCECGDEIGYAIRFEDISSDKTRVKCGFIPTPAPRAAAPER